MESDGYDVNQVLAQSEHGLECTVVREEIVVLAYRNATFTVRGD